jgi:dephospho-CoA kinase
MVGMYIVGLTGGIAAGKSVVASRLAELGAVVVDADVLAREVVQPGTPGLAAIAEAFGPSVVRADGSLDRQALGAIVFADHDKRDILNGITHPAIWDRARDLFDAAGAADPHAIVVYDVPLLVEASDDRPLGFDLVVVVHADAEVRVGRLVEGRGMSRRQAEARLAAQAGDDERLAAADVVIATGGTLEETREQVDTLWADLRARA